MIVEIMSLRHLKTEVFRLRMDFKKKKESDMSDKVLPNWIKVDKKRFNRIKNQIQSAEDNNSHGKPNRSSPRITQINSRHRAR